MSKEDDPTRRDEAQVAAVEAPIRAVLGRSRTPRIPREELQPPLTISSAKIITDVDRGLNLATPVEQADGVQLKPNLSVLDRHLPPRVFIKAILAVILGQTAGARPLRGVLV